MRRYKLPLTMLLATVLARPQIPLNELPACAQQAGLAAIDATGCSLTDIHCICLAEPFLNTLRSYIEQNCDIADQSTALTFGQELCLQASVTISAIVTGATGMPGAPIVTPAATVPTTTAVMGTATSTMTMSSAADIAPSTTSGMGMPSSTGTESPTFTGAAVRLSNEVMVALAGVAGVMALF